MRSGVQPQMFLALKWTDLVIRIVDRGKEETLSAIEYGSMQMSIMIYPRCVFISVVSTIYSFLEQDIF